MLPGFSSAPPALLGLAWGRCEREGLWGGGCEWGIKGLTPPVALALSGEERRGALLGEGGWEALVGGLK